MHRAAPTFTSLAAAFALAAVAGGAHERSSVSARHDCSPAGGHSLVVFLTVPTRFATAEACGAVFMDDHDRQRESARAAATNASEPGSIDEGQFLLAAAAITLESGIAAARSIAPGEVGDVDLAVLDEGIVFIIEVGGSDVHVDAETGDVLSISKHVVE